jgi:hypothetical protein
MATLGSTATSVAARSAVATLKFFGGEKLEGVKLVELEFELFERVADLTDNGGHEGNFLSPLLDSLCLYSSSRYYEDTQMILALSISDRNSSQLRPQSLTCRSQQAVT